MTVTWFDGIEIQVLAGFSAADGEFGVWGTGLWGTATWGPDTVFTDVSEWVRSISTSRRFSRELTEWDSGTATIVLKNQDGRFSPSNLTSPYVVGGISGIRPWRPIVVNIEDTPIFTGYVIAWQEVYEQGSPGGGGASVVIHCVDEMAALARFEGLETVLQGGGELAGERIHRILNNAGHTGLRALDVGRATLQPTSHGQNTVSELKLVADSDGGTIYIDRDGAVVFEDRYRIVEAERSRETQATFGDGGYQSTLRLTGGSTSTPDHTSLAITGDIDVRVHVALDNWVPGGFGIFIVAQWPNTGTNNAWLFGITAAGRPQLAWSPDGTTGAIVSRTSTEIPTFSTYGWIRATLDANNGAGSHDVRFYTSGDGTNWTQLGGVVNGAGTTSIFDSTANLAISNILPFTGNVRAVEIRNGINGTIVANPDYSLQIPGTTSLVDSTGKTWTRTGNANVVDDTTVPAELPYSDIVLSYDGDQLVNIVSLSRQQTPEEEEAEIDPPVYTTLAETSRALYGDARHTRTDLLNDSDADLSGVAELYLAAHKDAEQRVEQITFSPRGRPELLTHAVERRIRDRIRVIRRPPGGDTIVRDCHISGISHTVTSRGDWQVVFDLSSATVYSNFTPALWDTALWDADNWFF